MIVAARPRGAVIVAAAAPAGRAYRMNRSTIMATSAVAAAIRSAQRSAHGHSRSISSRQRLT